jgi:hypothetical protein
MDLDYLLEHIQLSPNESTTTLNNEVQPARIHAKVPIDREFDENHQNKLLVSYGIPTSVRFLFILTK